MNRLLRNRAHLVFRPRLFSLFRQPYRIGDLASDSAAGVTVGLIALPLALALGIASAEPGESTIGAVGSTIGRVRG